MSIKNTLKEIIIKSIEEYKFNINPKDIIIKKNKENNAYTTNIAIIIGNNLKKSPNDIAKYLQTRINSPNIIDNITITNTGLIDLFIKKGYATTYINDILKKKNKYGQINIGKEKKINISFKIFNLEQKLNIIDGRKAIYCDNLERILTYCNYIVTNECYINDLNVEKKLINLKQELDDCRIYFDNYTTEKTLYDKSIIESFLSKIRYTNYCYIKDDTLWIKTTEFGDSEDRLIIKEDGNYTDIVPILAYNYNKFNKSYDTMIDISTNNQDDLSILKSTLQILNKDPNLLKEKICGEINLKNNHINNLTDLINKYSINTIRYIFSLYNINNNLEFDMNNALNNSKDNPYNYIEETNIIISSILTKNRKILHEVDKYNTLKSDITYTIICKLISFEDVLISSCLNNNPSLIAYYVYELASLFHKYIEKEKIITDDIDYTNERLNLLLAIKIVLNNSLNLIGIIPME